MASGRPETRASAGPLGGDLHKLARRRPVPSIEGGHSFASLRRIVPATRRMKLAGRRGRLGGTSRNSSVGAAPSRPDRWSHLSSGCHGPRPKTAFVGEGGLARTNWFACEPLFFVRTPLRATVQSPSGGVGANHVGRGGRGIGRSARPEEDSGPKERANSHGATFGRRREMRPMLRWFGGNL